MNNFKKINSFIFATVLSTSLMNGMQSGQQVTPPASPRVLNQQVTPPTVQAQMPERPTRAHGRRRINFDAQGNMLTFLHNPNVVRALVFNVAAPIAPVAPVAPEMEVTRR